MFGTEAIEILKEVYEIAIVIKKHVETVQANKKQCQRLNERIQIVVSAAKGLEQLKDIKHYIKGLEALKTCLERCVNFINKFTVSSKWYKYLLKTSSYSEEFQELTELLEKSANLLQLGLNAQQIFNREKDKEDQKQDVSDIQSNQAHIIELNQVEMNLLQKLDMGQNDQNLVLQQQFESLKEQLNRLSLSSPNLNSPKPLIDPKLIVPFHQLLIDKQIAQGSFGEIYQGRWENSDVAIKMLVGHFTPEERGRFAREVDIMGRLRHPNIATLYGACLERGRACLVMPYYENQDLQRYLKSKPFLPEQQKQLALDIAKGLQYLHNQNVLHRSLKSSNVLIDQYGKAHLSDFGLSKIESPSIQTIKVEHQELYWQAPEFFERNTSFSEASDVFSYGVVLWEILTGQHPKDGYQKENDRELIQALTSGKHLPIPKNLPDVLQTLLQACWAESKKRPTLVQIIEQVESYQPRPPSPSAETYYEQGLKCEGQKNPAEALNNYQRASEKGYFKAHTNYGTFFLQGLSGVKQDKPKAAQLFEQAAKQGHVRAMMNLGMMKEYGDGIPKDIPGALKWYQEAAKLGDKKAPEKAQKLMQQSQGPDYQNNLASLNFQ